MSCGKRYVLVEGHGEVEAVGNLLTRLSKRHGDPVPWAKPLRWMNLHQWEPERRGGVKKGVEFVRPKEDAASLLVIRDEDDGCPKELGPFIGERLRSLNAPFPVAFVLLRPEFEVLFLPCLDAMAGRMLDGRAGLVEGTRWEGTHWEARRGLKEWLSGHFPAGRSYKPSMDQLALTRMIDLDVLEAANVPCFGTLDRALRFLFGPAAVAGAVYP